jgi:hypothetical protein
MGKFIAFVLVEGFLRLQGWLAGRSRAEIGYYPSAGCASPSSETAIFEPDQIPSHVPLHPESPR